MDIDLSKKELKTIMKIADEDHSGTVDFQEFLHLI